MLNSRITTGISCLHYEWQNLPEAFARAAGFGLDGIEFSTTRLEERDYARCAGLAAETGLAVSLHAWGDLGQQRPADAVEELRYLLEVCEGIAAGHLILHLGTHPQRAIGLERLAQVCRKVAPEYEQAGVTLCLENHYPYEYHELNELGGEPEDFLHILGLANSPAVRFCLDYGHSHMAHNTEDFIAKLGPYLSYTHIADNLGEHDDHLGPDDGTIEWPRVLRQTLATGFTGPFIIEFPEKGDPGRFARFLDMLQAAADETTG
ncbi:MAG: sugar phosphate isomerase/epimerase family protein [Armatimonadia bacterium]